MNDIVPLRGRVYMIDLGPEAGGHKPFLAVSNNARNRSMASFLGVRITTSDKPPLSSIIPLAPADPMVGRVLCDELHTLYRDEILREAGGLTLATMHKVAAGLRAALAV